MLLQWWERWLTTLVAMLLFSVHLCEGDAYCKDGDEDSFVGAGECYEFVESNSPISYDEAAERCMTRGKKLAMVNSAKAQSFLANNMEIRGWKQAMIGLKQRKSKWNWALDGRLLYGQGCWKDGTGQHYELNVTQQYVIYLTIGECVEFCRRQDTSFAGVQAARFCYCGNDFGKYGEHMDCTKPCGGNLAQFCGNNGANYIYHLDMTAFSNWAPGRPTIAGECSAVSLDGAEYRWYDEPCGSNFPFLCQTTSDDDSIPEGSVGSYCNPTQCWHLFEEARTWHGARWKCMELGGDLAKLAAREIQVDVVNNILGKNALSMAWIGATNRQWKWESGSALQYSSWAPTQPAPLNEFACTALDRSQPNYGWVTRRCEPLEDMTQYVCTRKKPSTPAPIQITTSTDTPLTAPSTSAPSEKVSHTSQTLAGSPAETTPVVAATVEVTTTRSDKVFSTAMFSTEGTTTSTSSGGNSTDYDLDIGPATGAQKEKAGPQVSASEGRLAWWTWLLIGLLVGVIFTVIATFLIIKFNKLSDESNKNPPENSPETKRQKKYRTKSAISQSHVRLRSFFLGESATVAPVAPVSEAKTADNVIKLTSVTTLEKVHPTASPIPLQARDPNDSVDYDDQNDSEYV